MTQTKKGRASKKYVNQLENDGWLILERKEVVLANGKIGWEYYGAK